MLIVFFENIEALHTRQNWYRVSTVGFILYETAKKSVTDWLVLC